MYQCIAEVGVPPLGEDCLVQGKSLRLEEVLLEVSFHCATEQVVRDNQSNSALSLYCHSSAAAIASVGFGDRSGWLQ